MSYEEICQIIKDRNLYKYLFHEDDCYLTDENGNDDLDKNEIEKVEQELATSNFTNYEQVDYVCNSDDMYCVIHFKTPDIYVKLTGEYDSYGGYDHEYNHEITQVFPKEITKIIYVENDL